MSETNETKLKRIRVTVCVDFGRDRTALTECEFVPYWTLPASYEGRQKVGSLLERMSAEMLGKMTVPR